MTLKEFEAEYFFHSYQRLPIEITHGERVYLFTKDGMKYLDMFGGLAVNALGYGNPKILEAITEQSKKFIHLSNFYLQEPQIRLAELLVRHSGYWKVFFSNSGTEAIEGAIKIARKWGKSKGKSEIISFTKGFHGRTLGAPYNDIYSLKSSVSEKTTAIVLEFIQGEAGIIQSSQEFVSELKRLKDKFDFLIIADEIQSGLGRTGKLFSFQHYKNISPDIVVVAKALGGGLPLGAILGNSSVAGVIQPGDHGSTFGGNPVACAAGVVVLNEIVEGGIMKNAEQMGSILKSELTKLKSEFPSLIKDVRGMGLMLGLELSRECDSIVTSLRERGVLINCTNKNILRFLPPLIINQDHIRFAIDQLRIVFKSL
ncbi:MAG: aminotransferase class III-fold pyridoxal phosphate-dependent enzyme [Ignavibacteriales bacterium]|nr:aminotransferase class III-fold pyridoxal phosphate-dependent enzyme [Ignavibacteriales bacterium]